jgi:hypothetical protein
MANPSSKGTPLIAGNYDSLVASLAGFLFIYFYSRHGGIGVSPDSVVYMSTAANIHDHGTINDFTGLPMMDFPAFYPIFLSGIMWITGMGCMQFAVALNGLLYALLIWLCGWIMQRFSYRSGIYKWALLVIIVLGPCLLEVYSMVWSETLFLVLFLFFMIAVHRYFRTHGVQQLLLMAVLAALACVTRYAGITFIGMGLLLLLCDGSLPVRKKAVHMTLFGLVSPVLFALNLYRNRLVTGTLTGFREKGVTPFSANLHDFGVVFCDWMPFFNGRYSPASIVACFLLLTLTGIFLYRLLSRREFFSFENIALSYFIVYSAFILTTATISRFQRLDSRLLCPLFLPWLWGASSWIPAALGRLRPVRRRTWGLAAIAVACCFGWGEWKDHVENWTGIRDAGIPGYTEDSWTKSETMDYVRKHKTQMESVGTIYSNAFEGLWFLAGVRSDLTPHKDMPDDIHDMMVGSQFSVITFDDAENLDLIDLEYISRYKRVENHLQFKDGTIYFFTTDSSRIRH